MSDNFCLLGVGGGLFTPANVGSATLIEWQRADAGVLNASGNPAANNDAVKTWQDQTANGNDQVQATVADQPTFKTNAQNGLPAILFNGTSDYLQRNFGVSQAAPYTIFVVFQYQVVPASAYAMFLGSGSAADVLEVGANNAAVAGFYVSCDGATSHNLNYNVDAEWHVLMVNCNGATSNVQMDGGAEAAFNFTATSNLNGLAVGGSSQHLTLLANVYIGELAVFAGTPSAGDIAALMQGLGQKWGLIAAADAFNQASGTDLTTTGWTLYEGDYQTQSGGGAQCISQSGNTWTLAVRNCGNANVVLNEQIEMLAGSFGRHGLCLRATNNGSTDTAFLVTVRSDTSLLEVIELNADSTTVRASAAITISTGTNYPLQASANGTTINASFNNAVTIQYTSASTNQTATSHGIIDGSPNRAIHFNWSCWL